MIWPPPGKSGPGSSACSSSSLSLSFFSSATVAAATSRRLWLGTSVAMPTAMPLAPLSSDKRQPRRQQARLLVAAVVVGLEVDRAFVDLVQQQREMGASRASV
jgi:hypothetical protein